MPDEACGVVAHAFVFGVVGGDVGCVAAFEDQAVACAADGGCGAGGGCGSW